MAETLILMSSTSSATLSSLANFEIDFGERDQIEVGFDVVFQGDFDFRRAVFHLGQVLLHNGKVSLHF